MAGFTDQFARALDATEKTDKELAEIAGVTIATINRIRNGHRKPSVDLVDKMTDVLGLEVRIEAREKLIASNEPGYYLREALDRLRELLRRRYMEEPTLFPPPDATDEDRINFVITYFSRYFMETMHTIET